MSKLMVETFDRDRMMFNFMIYTDNVRLNILKGLILCVGLCQQLAKHLLNCGITSAHITIMGGA